jgi:hypothetical protein
MKLWVIWQSGGPLIHQIAALFNPKSLAFISALLLIGLSACGGQSPAGAPFVPPTLAVSLAPTATAALLASPHPTATPSCQDNLTYISDLTVPDGSKVAPGAPIDKRWQVENSGSCNWDERYHLKLTNGPDLGAVPEQSLYPARAGTKATLRVLFTAPAQGGTYRSSWQAFSPDGKPFGDPIFIEITVNPS